MKIRNPFRRKTFTEQMDEFVEEARSLGTKVEYVKFESIDEAHRYFVAKGWIRPDSRG